MVRSSTSTFQSMEELHDEIKLKLGSKTLEPFGHGGGGCISSGQGYTTDHGKVYLKVNSKAKARRMFDGEYASLKAIAETHTVKTPTPMLVLDNPSGGALLVMEHLDMTGLSKHDAELGRQLARMHLHNESVGKQTKKAEASVHKDEDAVEYVSKYGFDTTTCCGFLPQDNTWCDDWPTFMARKLSTQITRLQEEKNEKEAPELWSKLQLKFPSFFENVDIKPALLHGDLWGGNVAEYADGPVIFDPSSFYGHAEYDHGIATMFGGFSHSFFKSYHELIPKCEGYATRQKIYQLFNYLNHWNHFGGGYRGSSVSIMRELVAS
ncbi:PREDICTED: ketosamine-3-kinase-like [Priapulus caudatus]|uniref:protein-ribulosamine 3-kinase n=1 Tax=Priapulus caudatus TaxID=37621 RepID=A0ABM1EMW0_PRICU|nr:PREDICTED: ketosamine-3-kinase-like [Priapulus caudatus]XP_014673531.1 PREDICTED: ketosamine-3-kinase-like [Priapulus caudatus]